MKLKRIRLVAFTAALLLAGSAAIGCGGDDSEGDGNNINNLNNIPADMGESDSGDSEDADTPDPIDSGPEDAATDDAGTDDAAPDLCEEGERVEAGGCVACDAGFTNEAGDDPTGADTQCEPLYCEANERVESNACVECGDNLVSKPGADATGADTECFMQDDCFASLGVDCDTVEQGYFKSDPSVNQGFFGITVAMNEAGDTLAASMPFAGEPSSGNVPNPATGKVHVFAKSAGTWSEQAVLYASNRGQGDDFGQAIAIDGDTLVVGAPHEDSDGQSPSNDNAELSGAAYVFTRSGQDWTEEAILKASNAEAGDEFGFSVAVDGDTVVVGARHEGSSSGGIDATQVDNSLTYAGAAYVFEKSAGAWSQTAYVKPPHPGLGDKFGAKLVLDADTLAVGVDLEDSSATGIGGDSNNDGATNSGAAFVYVREAGTWSLQAYLKASNAEAADRFGYKVALAGDTLAVAAVDEASSATGVGGDQNDNSGPTGAVYVFTRENEVWTQQAYIKALNTDPTTDFAYGQSLALSADGDRLAVGAVLEPSNATGIDGDMNDTSAAGAGAVYLYQRDDAGTWSEQAYVKSFNTHAAQRFGQDMAMSADGQFLFVGGHWENGVSSGIDGDMTDLTGDRRGAAYLYRIAPW